MRRARTSVGLRAGCTTRLGQQAGTLRADIPPEQAAEIYVSVMTITIRLWLTDYWDEKESLVDRGMRALTVLEDGLRARSSHIETHDDRDSPKQAEPTS